MQDQQQPAPDFGEPWKVGRIDRPMEDRNGHDPLMLHRTASRAVACVNACAGIANLDGIAVMRKALWDMSTGSVPSGDVRGLATYALNVLRGASQAPDVDPLPTPPQV